MFDDVAAIYDGDYFDKSDDQSPQFGYASYHSSLPIDFRWQQSLLRLFGADAPGTLLDVGCATGRFLALARGDGHRARGVELATVAAEQTRAMGFEVDSTLSDVAAEARFDVVTAWELLEHVPDLRATLTAIRDHLVEGGLFLFSTPDAGAPAVTARGDEWIGVKTSLEHLTYLTSDFLTPLVREIFECEPEFVSAGSGELWTLVGIVRRGGLRASDRERREQIVSRALKGPSREVAREIAWFWLSFDDGPAAAALVEAVRATGDDTHVAEALLALRTWKFEDAERHLERVVERSGWSSDVLQLMWRASLIRRDNANAQLKDARALEQKLRADLAATDGQNRELASSLERAQRTIRLLEAELGEAKQRAVELERQVSSLHKQLEVAMQSVAASAEQLRLLQVSAGYRLGRRVTRVLEKMPLAQPVWNRLDELANDGVRTFFSRRLDFARSTVTGLLRPKQDSPAPAPPAVPPATAIVQKRRPLIYVPIESGFVRGLISVILPVYNQANLLGDSIDSVLRQTYPHFELIVLNDGSRDDVERVLDRYRSHPKVRILTQANQGLPKALSNAFDFAQGELWTWTSADNIMESVQLERMFAFMRSRPDIDMTFADYLAIDDRGAPLTDPSFRPHNRKSPNAPEIHLPHDVSTLNTVQDNFIGPCFMYRGHVGLALGEYDPDMGVEDYDYWMRVNTLFQLDHFGTEEILYQYRVHDNSLNARAVEHRIYERVAKLMEYEQQRKLAYDEPFTLVPDERSREVVELLNLAPRANIGAPGASGKRVDVLAGDAPMPRLPRPGQAAIVWFERDSRAPYRWASAFARPEVVAAAVDEETLKRIAAAGGRGFGHAELARGFGAALAALDSTLFYERTRPRSLRLRHPPEIYRAHETAPTIVLEVQGFDKGGLEQVVIDLAVVLREGGANVIIVVLGAMGTAARTAQSLGLRVVAIPEQQRAEEYAALLERERVAIVNAHYSLFGAEICARAKIPFVQTIHNSYVWFTDEDKARYRAADEFTTAYVCVSMTAAQFSDVFLGIPPEKIVVLTNGIDTERFRPATPSQRERARQKHNIPKDAFVYLNVAGISDHKGQRQLVEAFQEVHRRHPESRLIIAGSVYWADFEQELRKLINASGIADAIHITGHVLNVEELYAASDAFVLPSFFEGWSLALAEALCSGLPSIATDCGAAREVFAETGGELVPLPYASLAQLDLTKLKTYMNVSEPLKSQLLQAMLRVHDQRPRPTVTEGTRRRYDRSQAFARHRDLFDWLLAGGGAASARRWLRAREADAVAAAEASGVTKSAASG